MEFQRYLLGIGTSPLRLQIASPLGEYSIRQPKPSMQRSVQKSELNVKSDPMKVNIDYSEVSASLGYPNQTKLRQKIVGESKQKVLRVIGETCQNGDRMLKTQGRAYADICQSKFLRGEYRLEQTFVPERPTITWTGTGQTKTDFTPYRQEITWETHSKAETEYIRRKPEISVAQWHKVDITYNGTPSDVTKIGIEAARKFSMLI